MISLRQTYLPVRNDELYTATAGYTLASPSRDQEVFLTKAGYHQQVNPVSARLLRLSRGEKVHELRTGGERIAKRRQ